MDTALLFVVYHTCWELWDQKNDQMYNHKHPTFSARKIVELAKEHIVVATRYSMSYKKKATQEGCQIHPPFPTNFEDTPRGPLA